MIELRRALPFLAFVLVLFVAGCSLLPKPSPSEPEGSIFPVGPAPGDTRAVDAALLAWQDAGIDDYRLDLGFLCGCAIAGNVIVDVEDGQPVRVLVNGNEVEAGDAAPFGLTVDGLLTEARRALTEGGTVTAQFDPANGRPTRLDIDYLPGAIDDELSIVVNSLTPAATDQN
jgi:hypothetical protein